MAYGDYGAYIWEDGVDVTEKFADKAFYSIEDGKRKRFYDYDTVEGLISEDTFRAFGHAVLNFGNFCVEFFKVYSPRIVFNNGSSINTKCLDKAEYNNKSLGINIVGYPLSESGNINMFKIQYKEHSYCVICGSGVGSGYDHMNVSKYIKKNIRYDKERKNYYIYTKHDVWIDYVFDKLGRLDEIRSNKYFMKTYGIKPFFKSLFKFKFLDCAYYFECILEYKETIKWLK